MPTYSYSCTACAHRFDAQQAFTDDALTECPQCGGRLRKLFGNVGVVFKGSGFYRTDARSEGKGRSSSSVPAGTSSGASSTSASDSGSNGSVSASAPAAPAAAPAASSTTSGSSSGGTTSA